ncbi:MAG: GIY-YIG nuclease family protein [Candidimonas sp.]|nr:MAG: GIY-YIG nuclease family protein [Candidimonas sp.]
MAPLSEDEMLAALGADTEPEPARRYTHREERLIAGFEDIQRFVEAHGHTPQHGEDKDIFERLYATRLDRLRSLPDARDLLTPTDRQGLLAGAAEASAPAPRDMDEDALLATLGANADQDDDIGVLRHVRSRAERQAAEAVADRQPCKDFDRFKPLFDRVRIELDDGTRKSLRFGRDTTIDAGNFFILAGQMVYVAQKEEEFKTSQGHPDARLRVIYANGMESDLLLRSLQRALYKDTSGRRITSTDADAGPLFGDHMEADDSESGTIYVLRSQSTEPFIAAHRELIHKIGVTGGSVEKRVAAARHDATYLLADVDIVATYTLSDIDRVKLENLLHRIFAPAQLELTVSDRFGEPIRPHEWFLVPLSAIDEAVNRIRDGSITEVAYDPATATLTPLGGR